MPLFKRKIVMKQIWQVKMHRYSWPHHASRSLVPTNKRLHACAHLTFSQPPSRLFCQNAFLQENKKPEDQTHAICCHYNSSTFVCTARGTSTRLIMEPTTNEGLSKPYPVDRFIFDLLTESSPFSSPKWNSASAKYVCIHHQGRSWQKHVCC